MPWHDPDGSAESHYGRLRRQLEILQAAPVKDLVAIDKLIDELEQVQLLIKGEQGLHGNNPND